MRACLRPLFVPTGLALLSACAEQGTLPPFKAQASVDELMESVVAHSAEVYWESVSITVGEEGTTERKPETDEQWEQVWAAAVALSESGNLLMMAPRAVDTGDWMRFALGLVDAGVVAAEAALAKDSEAVLAAGEVVYNACLDCHERYVGL